MSCVRYEGVQRKFISKQSFSFAMYGFFFVSKFMYELLWRNVIKQIFVKKWSGKCAVANFLNLNKRNRSQPPTNCRDIFTSGWYRHNFITQTKRNVITETWKASAFCVEFLRNLDDSTCRYVHNKTYTNKLLVFGNSDMAISHFNEAIQPSFYSNESFIKSFLYNDLLI